MNQEEVLPAGDLILMVSMLGRSLKKKKIFSEHAKREDSVISQGDIESFLFELENKELASKVPKDPCFQEGDKPFDQGFFDFTFPRLRLCPNDSLIFNDWRRRLSEFQDIYNLSVSPFEKNIEVWKNFTFILHQCDIIVQVIDARNVNFFWNNDICSYVNTIDKDKICLALISKCDLITCSESEAIAEYFSSLKVPFIFFSSKIESRLNPDLLLEISRHSKSDKVQRIGLVGYPNVGKSSAINYIIGKNKTAVSNTPGKTKHTQSFIINNFTIFDCPGLVFPKISSKDNLILNGVISLNSLTDYISPIRILLTQCTVPDICSFYRLKLLDRSRLYEFGIDYNDEALKLLYSFSFTRKFFTSGHGIPDVTKAAKTILKDYVDGKLMLNCILPLIREQFKTESKPESFKSVDFFVSKSFTLKEKSSLCLLSKA